MDGPVFVDNVFEFGWRGVQNIGIPVPFAAGDVDEKRLLSVPLDTLPRGLNM